MTARILIRSSLEALQTDLFRGSPRGNLQGHGIVDLFGKKDQISLDIFLGKYWVPDKSRKLGNN